MNELHAYLHAALQSLPGVVEVITDTEGEFQLRMEGGGTYLITLTQPT